mgnify:CR=1 FL=1
MLTAAALLAALPALPAAGIAASFPMDPQTQHRFINGLDDIGITLTHAGDIDSYEQSRPSWLS